MKMTAFIIKWTKKAIKEYADNNDIETLENEHFTLAFNQGVEMMKEMEKVDLPSKYRNLNIEEKENLLLEKIQENIDKALAN